MSIPDFQSLMLPVLSSSLNGEKRITSRPGGDMKLVQFSVQNYRNILDSGPIDVGNVTAFVGQNEAGKSNLFEALHCLNPITPEDTNPTKIGPSTNGRGAKQQTAKRCAPLNLH